MLITLSKQHAYAEDSEKASTHWLRLDEIVALCGQDFTESFRAGDEDSLHVEHVAEHCSASESQANGDGANLLVANKPTVRDLVDPFSHRTAGRIGRYC
jgi:hypothetical protein